MDKGRKCSNIAQSIDSVPSVASPLTSLPGTQNLVSIHFYVNGCVPIATILGMREDHQMKAWKDAEYRAAETLGGKRIALSGGGAHQDQGDVELPGWFVEVKYRKLWLAFSLFLEVERKAKREGKNALLILTEKNTHGQLAVMRIEDYAALPKVPRRMKKALIPRPRGRPPGRVRTKKGG